MKHLYCKIDQEFFKSVTGTFCILWGIMLSTAVLPVGISTENCLAWSSDGELAIAAGEEVYLLLPRHDRGEPWTYVHFRANAFTYDEWPVQKQVSFANMSIGVEQARVFITSLAWSPPGLAKHKRSVLAVLTSNLLLSLWAPGGDPTDSENWERVLLIDHIRIRSMAWAPTDAPNVEFQTPLSTRKWGTPLLITGNDSNQMSFYIITSPFTSVMKSWDYLTLGCETIPPVYKVNDRPSLLRDALNTRHFIDYLAFGDWDPNGSIPIIYRSSGVFYKSLLKISIDSLQGILSDSSTHQRIPQGHHDILPKAPLLMQDFMQKQVKDYCIARRLAPDDVIVKTWGVASLDNLVAVCVTSHPSKMIEYRAIAEESATIGFGSSEDAEGRRPEFPWQRRRVVDDKEVCLKILLTILDAQLLASVTLTSRDLKILYAATSAALFCPMTQSQRQSCLNAADPVLQVLEDMSSLSLQAERGAIKARREAENEDQEDSNTPIGQLVDQFSIPGPQLLDVCSVCQNGYIRLYAPREDFFQVFCPSRHPFGVYPSPQLTDTPMADVDDSQVRTNILTNP